MFWFRRFPTECPGMSGNIRPLSFRRGALWLSVTLAYTTSNNFACCFSTVLVTIAQTYAILSSWTKEGTWKGEGNGKGQGKKIRRDNKTNTIGMWTKFLFTFFIQSECTTEHREYIQVFVITIYLKLNLPFSIPPPNKNYGTRKQGWIFCNLALQTSDGAPLFV